jgi:spoIIIJ-associated protein
VSEPERATDGGTGPAELAGAEAPAAAAEWRDREPQTPPASADGWDLPAGGEVELAAGDRDEAGEETAPREPVEAEEEAEQDEELLDAAERAARVLLRFAGIDAEASSHSGPERVEVELEGPDSSVLVVENGTGLLAIQHLLPRMMRGLTGRSSFVRVDSEGFHGKRKERLQALARKEAEAVSRDGGRRTLPPMAPDERRIVHLAVQEIPTVETESEGSGLHKRDVIRPVAADGGHNDVEARHGF